MKVFVTGVAGQLGHDVMNELNKRGYEGIGSDIAPEYSGVQDGSAVTTMPYVSLDITDKEAVEKVLTEQKPDVVVHCAAWTGGYISWYDFTCEIFKQAGYSTNVVPVTTEEYGLSKAARPFNSRLDKSKLVEAGFTPLPTWQDALNRYLKEIEY